MPNGYRNGAFALGLIVGVGIALNLFLWLDYRARDEIEFRPSAGQDNQYSQVGKYWDGFVGTFVSPSASLAEWIMLVFTFVATVVLVLTLRSAIKTNNAAVKASTAALEANQIMRDEQRPWLSIELEDIDGLTWSEGIAYMDVTIKISNEGKNPATFINPDIEMFIPKGSWNTAVYPETTRLKEILQGIVQEDYFRTQTLFPGKYISFKRPLNLKRDDIETLIGLQKAFGLKDRAIPIHLLAVVTYRRGKGLDFFCSNTIFRLRRVDRSTGLSDEYFFLDTDVPRKNIGILIGHTNVD